MPRVALPNGAAYRRADRGDHRERGDRDKEGHPRAHLKDFRGVIHADGYAGFKELFAGNRIAEVGCWAHVRRKFFDVRATIDP